MTLPIDRFSGFRAGLESRAASGRLRSVEGYVPQPGTPYVLQGERRLLSFCSNDYLGLATDPEVVEAAGRVAASHGAGAGSSRLVAGGLDIHADLEAQLAEHTGRAAALLFNAGFQANQSIIPAVAARDGLVVCDERSHSSILQGCRLSRAEFQRFRHNDVEHLDALLAEREGAPGPAVIVTESLFSMDGDRAPLAELCEVAERHGALLMVDDAHAIGVYGERGEGLVAPHARVDLLLGTFGKAFGVAGAFVATNELLRSHLVNFCTGVVYSTAPPPPVVGSVRAALDAIRSGRLDQGCFRSFVARTHERFRAAGLDTEPSDSQIIPLLLGEDRAASACETFLRARDILAVAIRTPTVPEGSARLRISLTRLHTTEHVERLIGALTDYRAQSP
jgi:8-amino-7-oxononanoate synthase